jgi:glycosyltransferase involved in cell wall biosynthesis
LLSEGYPVTLTIVGKTQENQQKYWELAKRAWSDRFVGRAFFRGQVGKEEVECLLLQGDIYCSASLGEGSPNGALFALALGMPIVAPRLSSLADVSDPGIDRVSLFRAGDREDFYARLAAMVSLVRGSLQPVDCERTELIKRRLSEEETRQWLSVIRTVAMA